MTLKPRPDSISRGSSSPQLCFADLTCMQSFEACGCCTTVIHFFLQNPLYLMFPQQLLHHWQLPANAFQPSQENLVFNYPIQGATPYRFACLFPAPLAHRDPAPMACAPIRPVPVGPAPLEPAPLASNCICTARGGQLHLHCTGVCIAGSICISCNDVGMTGTWPSMLCVSCINFLLVLHYFPKFACISNLLLACMYMLLHHHAGSIQRSVLTDITCQSNNLCALHMTLDQPLQVPATADCAAGLSELDLATELQDSVVVSVRRSPACWRMLPK